MNIFAKKTFSDIFVTYFAIFPDWEKDFYPLHSSINSESQIALLDQRLILLHLFAIEKSIGEGKSGLAGYGVTLELEGSSFKLH